MQNFFAGFPFLIPDITEPIVLDRDDTDGFDLICEPLKPPLSDYLNPDTALPLLEDEILDIESPSSELLSTPDDQSLSGSSISDGWSDPCCDQEDADLWQPTSDLSPVKRWAEIYSWDAFYSAKPEPKITYLSDANASTYDAALSWSGQHRDRYLAPGSLLKALITLGLGRESSLFHHDQRPLMADLFIERGCMSGYSIESLSSITSMLSQYGRMLGALRETTSPNEQRDKCLPAYMALLCDLNEALGVIEGSTLHSSSSVISLLQVEDIFEAHREVLELFSIVISSLGSASSDNEVMTHILKLVKSMGHCNRRAQAIMMRLLETAARPWMNSALTWLRLVNVDSASTTRLPSFLMERREQVTTTADKHASYDLEYQPLNLPPILGSEDGRMMYETGCSLRLLGSYFPDHPILTQASGNDFHHPDIEQGTLWPQMESALLRAQNFEHHMAHLSKRYETQYFITSTINLGVVKSKTPESCLAESTGEHDVALAESLQAIEGSFKNTQIGWTEILQGFLHGKGEPEHLVQQTSLPLYSNQSLHMNPWISAQHRLANRSCVWLLFRCYNLRAHLTLLHRYQLLRDGPFTSRLCDALFSPDMHTSERKPHEYRVGQSGLNLGQRTTWPPASSELRLALTGILRENYFRKDPRSEMSLYNQDLPGNLSFAAREMSEAEIKRCLDPCSVYALDFLCMQYRAPEPLDAVLTTAILSKYDAIFRLLLRAKRTQYVVDRLRLQSRPLLKTAALGTRLRLRQICHHFVSSINQYFSDRVSKACAELNAKTCHVEELLDADHTEYFEGIYDFRNTLATVLDHLRHTLFLRKKYEEVSKLIDDIFGDILRAAVIFQQDRDTTDESGILCNALAKKIAIFIRVGRGLIENAGHGSSHPRHSTASLNDLDAEDDSISAISALLLGLEMNDFYDV